jgi:hypothetical protein
MRSLWTCNKNVIIKFGARGQVFFALDLTKTDLLAPPPKAMSCDLMDAIFLNRSAGSDQQFWFFGLYQAKVRWL